MSHGLPINHPLRPIYRVVAGVTGAWLLVFGAVGWSATAGADWFGPGDWAALGVSTNRALAAVSLVAGLVVLAAAFVGRNIDYFVNFVAAGGFIFVGSLMLALSHTEANFLNFSIITVSVSYVIGLVLIASALYGKVAIGPQAKHAAAQQAPSQQARAERPGAKETASSGAA